RLTANRKRLHGLVAERTHELERFRIESHCDPLTGLENRRRLIERLPVVLSRARVMDQEVGLIWFDVDGFSLCNQELGEHCGDQLLQLCARRIATHINGADTVSRAGDDEFVVILPGLDRADTRATMEKIIRLVRAPCTICDHTISVRVSAGLAIYPHDGESAHDLLRAALVAMRRSKPRFRVGRRLSIWPRKVAETQV
ncbi:MAG: GGDEF domain-containing protein, partial [Lysobacteraceae bacterium]